VTVEAGAIERSDSVRLEYARVVDEQRQRAHRSHGGRHEIDDRAVICEIAADHRRGSAGGRDFGAQVPGRGKRTVRVHRDRIAVAGQRQHDGAADSLGASGNEGGRDGRGRIGWGLGCHCPWIRTSCAPSARQRCARRETTRQRDNEPGSFGRCP